MNIVLENLNAIISKLSAVVFIIRILAVNSNSKRHA